MLRAVGRAVGAGVGPGTVQESFSTVRPKPTSIRPVSSTPSSFVNLPVSATSSAASSRPSSSLFVQEDDWENVEAVVEEEEINGVRQFSQRYVFGPVPSKEEVETAVSALQQALLPVTFSKTAARFPSIPEKDEKDEMTSVTVTHHSSSANLELEWIESTLQFYNPEEAHSQGHDHVLNALHLLKINPSVQRMVTSLSSDKAVWNAVMNNEVVKELRESFHAAESNQLETYGDGPQVATQFLKWILDNTKKKMAELIEKIMKLVTDLLQSQEKEKAMDIFEDTLRSSLMLSIMVLVVVVVTRVQGLK